MFLMLTNVYNIIIAFILCNVVFYLIKYGKSKEYNKVIYWISKKQ